MPQSIGQYVVNFEGFNVFIYFYPFFVPLKDLYV